jgi:hypothetical protein
MRKSAQHESMTIAKRGRKTRRRSRSVIKVSLRSGRLQSPSLLKAGGRRSHTSSSNADAPIPLWTVGALGVGLFGIALRLSRDRQQPTQKILIARMTYPRHAW